MITFGNGLDDCGLNEDSSVISFFGKHLGHSRAHPTCGKARIALDHSADAGGESLGATDGIETMAGQEDDNNDDDPEPDRRPRKTVLQNVAPALFNFASLSGYTGLGRSRVYQLIFEKKFPPPIKIGKSSRWVRAEIDHWLQQKITDRSQSTFGRSL